jgi:hypothetical protein
VAAGSWLGNPGVVVTFILLGIIGFAIHYVINSRAKRQALRVLESYKEAYLKRPNTQLTSARISELLKRVALVYYPREQVASLVGDEWIAFLNETGRQLDFNLVSVLLVECPYRPSTEHDLLPLFHLAQQWIKQRSGRCLK